MRIIDPYKFGVGIDADVQAFLTATGITDPTITTALINLVAALKSAGLWSKMIAIYPIVGGTAGTHKYNLKDPQDTDAAFRMTFSGTITHNAAGMAGDGSTGYGNTHLTPSSDIPANEGSNGAFIEGFNFSGFGINHSDGCRTTGNKQLLYTAEWSDGNCYYAANGSSGASTAWSFFGVTTRGFVQNVRKDSANSYFQIATTRVSYAAAYDPPTNVAYFLCENFNGTPSFFSGSGRIHKYCFIGGALTTAEMDAHNTAVAAFQSDLSR